MLSSNSSPKNAKKDTTTSQQSELIALKKYQEKTSTDEKSWDNPPSKSIDDTLDFNKEVMASSSRAMNENDTFTNDLNSEFEGREQKRISKPLPPPN